MTHVGRRFCPSTFWYRMFPDFYLITTKPAFRSLFSTCVLDTPRKSGEQGIKHPVERGIVTGDPKFTQSSDLPQARCGVTPRESRLVHQGRR